VWGRARGQDDRSKFKVKDKILSFSAIDARYEATFIYILDCQRSALNVQATLAQCIYCRFLCTEVVGTMVGWVILVAVVAVGFCSVVLETKHCENVQLRDYLRCRKKLRYVEAAHEFD